MDRKLKLNYVNFIITFLFLLCEWIKGTRLSLHLFSSKVIRGIFAQKEGEPGNKASLVHHIIMIIVC